jgi:isopenicillin N synthase-like dioxygenase
MLLKSLQAAGRTRGIGAHTDFGALTLLLQDEVGGLEVLHKPTGTWHAVTPVKGAYVCNIGDLMQRWTNDQYQSTMHRVISPLSNKDRYSCAFFNDGKLSQIIEALPGCVPAGEKAKYGPLRVEEHIVKRYQQSYGAGDTIIAAPAVGAAA